MRRLLLISLLAIAADGRADEPPAADTKGEKPEPAASVAAARDPDFRTIDRLELGTTSITGNQELPKVMYVVPWKKADLGGLSGRPTRSLIDEILAPVDRDEFRREVGYFETLDGAGRTASAGAETPVTPQTAKP